MKNNNIILLVSLTTLVINIAVTRETHASNDITAVAALGRIEPENGIIRIGAASTPESTAGSIIASLYVTEGELVKAGQLLAKTDSAAVSQALVMEAQKEFELSNKEFEAVSSQAKATCVRAETARSESFRREQLSSKGLAATEEAEQAQGIANSSSAFCSAAKVAAGAAKLSIAVAEAKLRRREAEYQRKLIYSPLDAMVLQINSYAGEFVSSNGVLELAAVERMYAVAEVYETDITRVKVGQKATINSDAFATELLGEVTYIHRKVQKHDAIGTDPAARKDARIVEVDILLEQPETVRYLTNLQVEIIIE